MSEQLPVEAPEPAIDYSDANATLDADEDRWAWRARLRRNPATHLAWRTAVGVVGGLVTVAGLIMVPAPGPGWLVVFFGLMILASEFEFAQRVLDFARRQVGRWNDWVMAQPIWVRGLVALATLLLVWALFWVLFALAGVPGFVPDWAADALRQVPGID
ncbi:membrane protein [Intrasporangium chromatireducens Q5-1]|uniref:Membrane protein n=1 Tax=Intrasporangium chromatireducens Q5-1 TaxID=584657 RepID=W9GES0_9MICO|nr:TIGR02611 family protein [Intrasporangium chromatireducens]EWT04525.1 membrane protein [Intrasporangium chromatireducens Q5-1]